MVRKKRDLRPNALVHANNGGVARRPMFETADDVLFLLNLFAAATREGRIEICAYAILSTHFHILGRNVDGRLSEGLQWIQSLYARHFNDSRGREGHLVGARFFATEINDPGYLAAAYYYIDMNPVLAGLARRPQDYPWGSAFHFARGEVATWLRPEPVAHLITSPFNRARAPHGDFSRFASVDPFVLREIVERRARTGVSDRNFSDLINASSRDAAERLRRHMLLADGEDRRLIICAASEMMAAVAAERGRLAALHAGTSSALERKIRTLTVGLMREFSGLSQVEISERLGLSQATVCRSLRTHSRRLHEDETYLDITASIVERATRRTWCPIDRELRFPAAPTIPPILENE
ncbi:MAG: hypothetical protein R3F20_13380 [Planctomycetota bacterium]